MSRFGSVELYQVELESVDRVKEFGKGRVLEDSDEEGFARMRSDSRGLEGEPIESIERRGRGRGRRGSLSSSDGSDDLLCLGEGDVPFRTGNKDQTEEICTCFSRGECCFGSFESADLDEWCGSREG